MNGNPCERKGRLPNLSDYNACHASTFTLPLELSSHDDEKAASYVDNLFTQLSLPIAYFSNYLRATHELFSKEREN